MKFQKESKTPLVSLMLYFILRLSDSAGTEESASINKVLEQLR